MVPLALACAACGIVNGLHHDFPKFRSRIPIRSLLPSQTVKACHNALSCAHFPSSQSDDSGERSSDEGSELDYDSEGNPIQQSFDEADDDDDEDDEFDSNSEDEYGECEACGDVMTLRECEECDVLMCVVCFGSVRQPLPTPDPAPLAPRSTIQEMSKHTQYVLRTSTRHAEHRRPVPHLCRSGVTTGRQRILFVVLTRSVAWLELQPDTH